MVPELFGGRDQTPHNSFGVTEVGRYAGAVKQVPAFGESPDLAEFPQLVVVVAVSENGVDTERLVTGNTPKHAKKGV